jgi:3-dehydroquinate dehydratase-2
MPVRLWILNGPNLNLLGEREPEIYGSTTLAAVEASCRAFAEILGVRLECRQSNRECVLVHSIPMLDVLKVFGRPIIEVHISNIHARDELHRHSILSGVSTAVICGLGTYGYILAMQAAARMVGDMPGSLPEPIRVGPV